MIKYKNELDHVVVENHGNIAGKIDKEVVLTPAEMLDKSLMFNVITLPKGSTIKEHKHEPDAEIYYILEGEVVVTDNEKIATLHAGDVLFTGNGDRHSITNHCDADARFLACILK